MARPFWHAESAEQVNADVQASDALLPGRTTYDIFRVYWPGRTDQIGRAFDRVPRYVASRGTPELCWDTSIQVTDVATEVRDLRERHEQIHTWGSGDLLQTSDQTRWERAGSNDTGQPHGLSWSRISAVVPGRTCA